MRTTQRTPATQSRPLSDGWLKRNLVQLGNHFIKVFKLRQRALFMSQPPRPSETTPIVNVHKMRLCYNNTVLGSSKKDACFVSQQSPLPSCKVRFCAMSRKLCLGLKCHRMDQSVPSDIASVPEVVNKPFPHCVLLQYDGYISVKKNSINITSIQVT